MFGFAILDAVVESLAERMKSEPAYAEQIHQAVDLYNTQLLEVLREPHAPDGTTAKRQKFSDILATEQEAARGK